MMACSTPLQLELKKMCIDVEKHVGNENEGGDFIEH